MTNIRTNSVETPVAPTPRALLSTNGTKSLICLLAIIGCFFVLQGCSSVLYHKITVNPFSAGRWDFQGHLNDRSWLVPYCGNYDSLMHYTNSDRRLSEYYSHFKQDTGVEYYSLSLMTLLRRDPGVRCCPPTVVKILSVKFHDGVRWNALDLTQTYSDQWTYTGHPVSGVEPIPIATSVKEGTLFVEVILQDTTGSRVDSLGLSLPVVRKRLTRTLLNPWP